MPLANLPGPLISVVMPVYNGARYLVDSIASITEQTLGDWELICVNDGSSDNSQVVLDWFASQDKRIRVIHQPNLGIVDALNAGCAIARAPLICRMDCDDIAFPARLERQANFMRANPNCIVVGGGILEIDEDGDPLNISRLPTEHDDILNNLLHRKTGHFHPTTMIRAEAMEAAGGYRKKYQWVEDHDLWLRLAQRGKLANLPDIVLCYRQHADSVCWQRSAQQRELMNELIREAYTARNLPSPNQLLASAALERSAAGPGKWARLAAKGGYPRTTCKQLSRLWRSEAKWQYKTRMSLEAILRMSGQYIRRLLDTRPISTIPSFPHWHALIAEHLPDQQVFRQLAA